jgi:LL-diaminopimelate aminotransferase
MGKIKTNIDSGIFQAVQEAGTEALLGDQQPVEELRKVYQARRDLACGFLSKKGFSFEVPRATFYLWVRTPEGLTSAQFVGRVLTETGVVLTAELVVWYGELFTSALAATSVTGSGRSKQLLKI